MMHSSQITIQNCSYSTLFSELNLTLGCRKTAIIGKNGVGKTTLLKLLLGELTPSVGSINRVGTITYCPQHPVSAKFSTVAQLLAVDAKLGALKNVQQGSVQEADFELIGDDWDLLDRIKRALQQFNLAHVAVERQLASLSSGELSRLWLARAFLSVADFLIFDEPTNNLDHQSRQLLYDAIKAWNKGLIIVTHDRELLQLMEQIVELTTLGCTVYGGNYDFYLEQKKLLTVAREKKLQDAEKLLQKTKRSIQDSREKHAQRMSKGYAARKSGSQAKIILNNEKERSEKTKGMLAIKEQQRLEDARSKLQQAKAAVKSEKEISAELTNTKIPARKLIAEFESVSFAYDNENYLLDNYSLTIHGPKRIAVMGINGSGKTSMIKLLIGKLQPEKGKITMGVSRISYLDQQAAILMPQLSILDNFQKLNPEINSADDRALLAGFLFRGEKVQQQVATLSGGEKLRAALACILPAKLPPQLLILDEPTNHLDLDSIKSLENILNYYQGALIVISHDSQFLTNIGVTSYISAPFVA
ncbi:MAG: ABC-F family ATP-binding cassette domain-containing protein [Gammaproteobacteria bacterium]|nr:ABC-F family ATP-binding cassette domain-containing protein [Gammaproteobacteria bacterium]